MEENHGRTESRQQPHTLPLSARRKRERGLGYRSSVRSFRSSVTQCKESVPRLPFLFEEGAGGGGVGGKKKKRLDRGLIGDGGGG